MEFFIFVALICPMIGLVTVIAGWSVGEVIRQKGESLKGIISRYLHLTVLGFLVYVAYYAVNTGQ